MIAAIAGLAKLYSVKKLYSRWYRSQLNKIEKAWVGVEILYLEKLMKGK